MGIPILNELNEELTRLYVAGSPLAKGDPRVSRYIAPLQKLGERAPVFGALAARLEALVAPDGEKDSPRNLMEAGMLLQSVLSTQGDTAIGETAPMAYADRPLPPPRTPYSRLRELEELLEAGGQLHAEPLEAAMRTGVYADPRLFRAYVEAVGDSKSPISNYVAERILPALGEEVLPFIMDRLDLTGGKRNARLLRVVHAIRGREALPLAEQALAEGAPHVMAEALYILGEDAKYEETLLGYTKDRKGELRQAAFAALTRMHSEAGEAALLEALYKSSITALEEALYESDSPAVAATVLEQAKAALPGYKESAVKLKVLLRVLAARDEPAGLAWLETVLSDAKFYAEAVGVLDLYQILQILCDSDTPAKNELLLRVCEGDGSKLGFYITVCVRLFDAAEVYNRCHKPIKAARYQYGHLTHAYGIRHGQQLRPDSEKTWDRRWSAFYAKAGNTHAAFLFLYNDDDGAWKALLDKAVEQAKIQRHPSGSGVVMLRNAFEAGYKDAGKYRDRFLKNGFPRERIAELLGEYATRD